MPGAVAALRCLRRSGAGNTDAMQEPRRAAPPTAQTSHGQPSAAGTVDTHASPLGWYLALLAAALVGITATIIQIIERIQLAEAPGSALICDLNATFSCGGVIVAEQSSVFGPIPNAAIGLLVFAVMASAAVAGVSGTRWRLRYWVFVTFLAGFMGGFTIWFLYQTAFVIGKVCLWCLGIGLALLLANASVWRLGWREGHLDGSSRFARAARWTIRGGTDLVLWAGLGSLVAIMMVAGLG
jgi:uncharacterized membrane protein